MLPHKNWQDRPFEIRNFMNPYFCTTLIWESVDGFCQKNDNGMSFPLLFIILPCVLHDEIQNTLPNKRTNTTNWINKLDEEIVTQLPSFCHSLAPYTREAIILGRQKQVLLINDEGLVKTCGKLDFQEETSKFRKKAKLFGYLLAVTKPEIIFNKLNFAP